MKGRIIADWSKVDFSNPDHRKKVFGALQHFIGAPLRDPELVKALQAFGTSGDFPTSILGILEKYHLTTDFDNAWERLFDVRDYTQSQRNGFEIHDVEDGLSFAEVDIGERAKIYKMSGSKVTVNFALFGAGLGWHRTLIDDAEFWTLEDNAIAFNNKSMSFKAQHHYDLIDAVAAAQDLAWQVPDPSALATSDAVYTANRDAQTLNEAAVQILTDVKDKGYGVNPNNAQFEIIAPLQLQGRLRKAMSLMLQPVAGSQSETNFSFTLSITQMLASSTVYYVVLPKIKMKSANRMSLIIQDKYDPSTYSDAAYGWMRFGAAIGDVEQIQRCATA